MGLPQNVREQEYTYATTAQLPVPEGDQEKHDWVRVGEHSLRADAPDHWLVVVNKGRAGENEGFHVCDKCGAAEVYGLGQVSKQHWRPYRVQSFKKPPECDGEFQQVFLGNRFQSDLMLWRIEVSAPLGIDTVRSVVRQGLKDALQTLAEGLQLASSRFFDLDANEFSAGYRIVPGLSHGKTLRADVYIFDTLAGGAGYADQVGRQLGDILVQELRPLLRDCEGNCDRSCYECLRHYANQYWHASLDRFLGLGLLDYALDGTIPSIPEGDQARRLDPLKGMLELTGGYVCRSDSTVGGVHVPLLVERGATRVAVACYHALIDEDAPHPLREAFDDNGLLPLVLNDYLLTRNLPAAYQAVLDMAGKSLKG
jgi:hypothetical protein